MKSPVVKRSIVIAGHKTSVSLEDAFWKGLKDIAGGRDTTLSDLVASIDSERRHGNLSSAIRLFVLDSRRSMFDRASVFASSSSTTIAPWRATTRAYGTGRGRWPPGSFRSPDLRVCQTDRTRSASRPAAAWSPTAWAVDAHPLGSRAACAFRASSDGYRSEAAELDRRTAPLRIWASVRRRRAVARQPPAGCAGQPDVVAPEPPDSRRMDRRRARRRQAT